MINRILTSFLILFFSSSLFSQKKMTQEEYVQKYYKIAIKQMKEFKIPASITLAQGILESGNGNSDLSTIAHNHFGIKCHKEWKGKTFYMDDDTKDECFRVYNSVKESYVDHSLFLTKRGRYSFLFTDYKTTDYKKWAHGLKKAGYATNPKYPQLLITLIERHHLYKYDRKNFVPEETTIEDVLVLEEIKEKDFEIEKTDQYIKALMGRNVYYSNKEKGVFIFNRIKTIKSKGKSPLEIAVEFDVNYELLLKYNDINAEDFFTSNQNVFLQPKRFKGSQKSYLVKPGDSMWEISQMFGIKLNHLYSKNLIDIGQQAKPGETLSLKKKQKEKIATIGYAEVLKEKKKLRERQPKKIVQKPIVKPIEININIFDKTDEKKIVINKPTTQETSTIYPKGKYVDKNEEMTKIINSIPTINKPTTISEENTYQVVTHTVLQGETLYFLSKKHNVSIENLKKWNALIDNSINIGQKLIISQKQ